MLAKIALGTLVVVVLLAVAISTRQDRFRVARKVTIAAPAEVIFAQINDLHRWGRWNPFEKLDPSMAKTFAGPEAGPGASFHYVGKKAGEGRMTVTESTPHERVAVRGEFIKPFAATNVLEFTLEPVAEGVTVTWAMSGKNTVLGKTISLVMDMDTMLGKDFESGLAALKQVSEEEARSVALVRP